MTVAEDYRAAVFFKRVLVPAFSGVQRLDALEIREGMSRLLGDAPAYPKRVYFLSMPTDPVLHLVSNVELVEWGLTGCRAGYFPLPFAERVQGFVWWSELDGLGPNLAERLEISAAASWEPDSFEFGEALYESLETFDLRERERLRLVYFAVEDEWEHRLSQLRDFAIHLETEPSAFLRSVVVDNIAWGLLEEPYSGIIRTPSQWRFEWARAARRGQSTFLNYEFLVSVGARLSALAEVRARIEAVARDLDADPAAASATALQRTIEMLRRTGQEVRTPIRPLSPMESADHEPEPSPASSGLSVRQDAERKYLQYLRQGKETPDPM